MWSPPPESNRRPHPYHSCGPAPIEAWVQVEVTSVTVSDRQAPSDTARYGTEMARWPVSLNDTRGPARSPPCSWPLRVAAAGVLGSGSLAAMGSAGTYRFGPEAGRLLVKTTRTGLGAKAGHDLTIVVTRWRGRATVDTSDPASSSVVVEVEVDSLEVREGTGGVKPLTDADRAEIKRTLAKILHTAQHPTITFRSRQVEGSVGSFTVDGELTVMGVTRPVMVQGRMTDGRVVGGATVVQSQWGIRPYSASIAPGSLGHRVGRGEDACHGGQQPEPAAR